MNAFEFCPPRPYEAALHWNAVVSRHRIAHTPRAAAQVLFAMGGYAALWLLMAQMDVWPGLLLTLPAGCLLLRIFFVLHDCRGGAFFYTRAANAVTGFLAGMLTFTPFTAPRWSGGKRIGQTWEKEIEMWLTDHGIDGRHAKRMTKRAAVRWIVVPFFMVTLQQRFSLRDAERRVRCAVWLMNAALAAMMVAMIVWLGLWKYLLLQCMILAVAAAAGVALYRMQREFEALYWRREQDGEVTPAALSRYAYFRLPRLVHWLSGGAGFQRLHDAGGRVPGYNLGRCHDCHPAYSLVRGRTLRAFAAATLAHCAQWLRLEAKAAGAAVKAATGQWRSVNTAAQLAAAHRLAAELRLASQRRLAAEHEMAAAPAQPVTA